MPRTSNNTQPGVSEADVSGQKSFATQPQRVTPDQKAEGELGGPGGGADQPQPTVLRQVMQVPEETLVTDSGPEPREAAASD